MIATLFDFDGVLVDSEPVHLAAFRDVLAPLGIALSDEAYAEKYLGLDDHGAFREILTAANQTPSPDRIRELIELKKPAFMQRFATSLRVFEGAAEIVRRRAAKGTVAIVSGALEHEIRFGLEQMGVLECVAFIVAAEACSACKPDPEGYLLAKAKLGDSVRAVVIEDSISGVLAAKRAGIRCAAVAHTYAGAELAAAGADAIAPAIAALTDAMIDGSNV